MIFKIFITITFLIPLLALGSLLNPDDLSVEDGRKILCSVLTELEKKNGIGVWPSYNPLESPLIIKFKDRIVGFGSPTSFKDWVVDRAEKCTSYSAPITFKTPTAPIVPYLDFMRSKAFFFDVTIKEKLSVWLLSAIIHERFHRFQWEHFPNVFLLSNSKYSGHDSVENVAQALLENHRLASYLKSNEEKDWIDFLSIASIREINIQQESKNLELDQQISEGTAVYVQMKSFEVIEKEFGLHFRNIWIQKMIGNLDDSQGVDGIVKLRHYAVGSMVCDYLDRHTSDENWKSSLQSQTGQSIFRNAISVTRLNESSLQTRGREIIASSDGDSTWTKAAKIVNEYSEEISAIKTQIQNFRFQIEIGNLKKYCSGGGASEKTYYLPDGGTLRLNYSGSQKCDIDYQASFINIPVLFESKDSSFFGLNDIAIFINSSEVKNLEGQYKFNNLKLESKFFLLQTSAPGILTIFNSRVQILFDNL